MAESELAPKFAPFFSFAGIAAAMIFGSLGAAYGTAKSGIGIAGVGTFRPDLIMKSLIPVVMSGIIAVYGLVIAVLIAGDVSPTQTMDLYSGFMHLAAGLSVGLAGVAAGYAIGIVGDAVSNIGYGSTRFYSSNHSKGCALLYATIACLCRNDPHSDFRGSPRSLRSNCWSDPQLQDLSLRSCSSALPATWLYAMHGM